MVLLAERYHTDELINGIGDRRRAAYGVIGQFPQTGACITLDRMRFSDFKGAFWFTGSESLLTHLKWSFDKDHGDQIWSGEGPQTDDRFNVPNAIDDEGIAGRPVRELEDVLTKG